ncbi:MAG: protein-L-isoaspartate(D-aspartate) O-methyltransferase [Burkholderiaceae bacterium]
MTAAPPRGPKFPLRLNQLAAATVRRADADLPGGRHLLRPQQPLAHAHANAARHAGASGLGLDSADVRRRMTLRLQDGGIHHPAVLSALAAIERHRFVDAALVTQAYEDTSLPIGHGQTISKPSVVARMIELLFDGAKARATGSLGRVLEIGTGCGYQAGVLSMLAQHVVTIERVKPLHDRARELLAPLRADRLRLVFGDGMLGHAPNAPYDSIIAAAGGDELPLVWLDQLAVGGRLVAPMRRPGASQQTLAVVDRTDSGYQHAVCEAVKFVPLKSGLVR